MAGNYQRQRQENIRYAQQVLRELGLREISAEIQGELQNVAVSKEITKAKKTKSASASSTPRAKKESDDGENSAGGRRKSARLANKTPNYVSEGNFFDEESYGKRKRHASKTGETQNANSSGKLLDVSRYRFDKPKEARENFYGAAPGVQVGFVFISRMECSYAGVHRPPVSGIHGGAQGAYSIAMSGDYEDDVDSGDLFTYTGEGGRDLCGTPNAPKNLRTAPQSKDQVLTRGNLALAVSIETKNPVRVVRGYKLNSPFAPAEGYRYDGLYTVEKCWQSTGISGFKVYRFALKKCAGTAPLVPQPAIEDTDENEEDDE